MLKNLIKIASDLDKAGLKKEADIVDLIIRRVASSDFNDQNDADDTRLDGPIVSDEELSEVLSDLVPQESDEDSEIMRDYFSRGGSGVGEEDFEEEEEVPSMDDYYDLRER